MDFEKIDIENKIPTPILPCVILFPQKYWNLATKMGHFVSPYRVLCTKLPLEALITLADTTTTLTLLYIKLKQMNMCVEANEHVCVFTCSRCLSKEKNKLIKASQQMALERPEATGDPAFVSHLQTPAVTRRWHIFPRVPAFSFAQGPLQPPFVKAQGRER